MNESKGSEILAEGLDSPFTSLKIRKLMKIISESPSKDRLADVGCFDGKFFKFYKSCGVKSIDGFDILPDALDLARKQDSDVRTFLWNFEGERAPAGDSEYDIIVCSDVIEHLFDPDNLLSECFRILKPSGIFILLTPNLASAWNRYLSFRGRMPLGHPGVSPMKRTETTVNLAHSRIGTSKEWAGLLLSSGFKVQKIDGIWSGNLSRIVCAGRPTLSHTLVFTCSK